MARLHLQRPDWKAHFIAVPIHL